MLAIGGKSSWSHTFHNDGLQVTETDTVYYLDGIETLRHPTNDVSKTRPTSFGSITPSEESAAGKLIWNGKLI